jgi:hypothetical protein
VGWRCLNSLSPRERVRVRVRVRVRAFFREICPHPPAPLPQGEGVTVTAALRTYLEKF